MSVSNHKFMLLHCRNDRNVRKSSGNMEFVQFCSVSLYTVLLTLNNNKLNTF